MLSQTLHEKNQYDDGLVALSDGHSFGYNHKLGEKKKKKKTGKEEKKENTCRDSTIMSLWTCGKLSCVSSYGNIFLYFITAISL
jgi:hypothetical protein